MTNKTKAAKSKAGTDRRRPTHESTMAILTRLLLTPVPSTANGNTSVTPPLEAIVTQLLRRALEGHARSVRVLERYKQLAAQGITRGVTVEFVENAPEGGVIGERDV